jgi:predicted DNA-binding WGR domain protein
MTKARELFEMVYQWGRVGVITDEHCPAFKDKLAEIIQEAQAEAWDRCEEEWIEYEEKQRYMAEPNCIHEPTNPYKETTDE